MALKKMCYYFDTKNNFLAISNIAASKIFFSGLFLILSLFLFGSIQNMDQANAQPSLGQNIQEFQNNLQSNINKQVHSGINQGLKSSNNNNNINCNGSNNFSIQSQTTTNGKTTSSSQSNCGGSVQVNPPSNNLNLKGIITSSEYDKQTGAIINILYGNWSLKTSDKGITDFNSLFTKQPVYLGLANIVQSATNNQSATTNNPTSTTNNINLSSSIASTNSNAKKDLTTPQPPQQQQQQSSNVTTYYLSNFKANTLQQQNQDITYVGLIDVVKTVRSNDPTQQDQTNDFKDVGVAISILNGRTLVINFLNQSPLYNEFSDIPLVGIVTN
jgi:hypothetical protein